MLFLSAFIVASATPPVIDQVSTTDFGLAHLVLEQQDWVLRGAFLFLILMSIVSWTIIIYRMVIGMVQRIKNRQHYKILTSNQYQNYQQAYHAMHGKSSIKLLVHQALISQQQFAKITGGPLTNSLNYGDYLQRNIRYGLEQSLYSRDGGLAILATIGATAPFVGLFGTVWGIYHALISIFHLGNVNLATIAGPIGEALIATAIGLFVAIPAVLAYNLLVRRNRVQQRYLDGFAHDLYNSFLEQGVTTISQQQASEQPKATATSTITSDTVTPAATNNSVMAELNLSQANTKSMGG